MNYFSFSEIAFGVFLLGVGGALGAVFSAVLHLILSCRGLFLETARALYQNRARIFLCYLPKKDALLRKSPFFDGIVDFFNVIFLALGYLLSTYVAFDGLYRVLCIFPLIAAFFLTRRFLLPSIEKWVFLCIRLLLAGSAFFMSVPIFLLFLILRVLKSAFSFIIYLIRRIFIKAVSRARFERYLRKIDRSLFEALKKL